MGKKDKKKGKGAEKTASKTEKKFTQKLKKELALKGEEDIESLLAEFAKEDKKKNSILEELVSPPSKRTSFSLTAHPDKDHLILFGGEYFNGKKTFVYNDLYFYHIKQNRWIKLTSPGGPPPRSSHQAVAFMQGGGQLWIFGGEFMSPTQSQFYHYKDLWVFHFNTKKWEKVVGNGNGPSSRSGHRMVGLNKQLVIFGGFHDNTRDYKYFNDIHIFNFEHYSWHKIEPTGNGPCPRSGCQMVPLADGRILVYGGYSKERVKKEADKGITHSDMYTLNPDKHDNTGLKWKWVVVKACGAKPSPRCAFSMSLMGVDKAILFGGVYDTEENEEELEGIFYNDLYQLDLNKMVWHKVRVTGKKDVAASADKRRRRKVKENDEGDEDEGIIDQEEVRKKLDEIKMEEEKKRIVSDDGVFTVTVGPSVNPSNSARVTSDCYELKDVFIPPPRINPGLAVKKGVLYIYGGMFEEGDKQLTLNDFHSLDLNKLDEWNTIISLNAKDLEWFDSDSDDSDSDSDSDDVETDDEISEGETSDLREMEVN